MPNKKAKLHFAAWLVFYELRPKVLHHSLTAGIKKNAARRKAAAHRMRSGGDAHECTILRSPTADGDTPCTCGRAAGVSVSADAVLFDCVWRCAGGGRVPAAQVIAEGERGTRVAVRMICIRTPRILRGLVRMLVRKKG